MIMKKGTIGIALMLMLAATPLLAQVATVGVYFDAAGTQVSGTFNGGVDEFHQAYVVVFWEAFVGGASYQLNVDPRVSILSKTYPLAGVQIGDPLDGCGVEIGLSSAAFGFYSTPVVITELTFWTGDQIIYDAMLCVEPHCNYSTVVVADRDAQVFEAAGLCAFLTVPVANEADSWGAVKNLYK
jgi:hypothetical protein